MSQSDKEKARDLFQRLLASWLVGHGEPDMNTVKGLAQFAIRAQAAFEEVYHHHEKEMDDRSKADLGFDL